MVTRYDTKAKKYLLCLDKGIKHMQEYIIRCFFQMIIVLLAMIAIVLLLGRQVGEPVSGLPINYVPQEDKIQLARYLRFDKSSIQQYDIFMSNALEKELDKCVAEDNKPALNMILERLPASLDLTSDALMSSAVIGVVPPAVSMGLFA